MVNRKSGIRRYHGVTVLLLMSLLLIPASLLGESAYGETEGKVEEKAGFELTVKDDLISLSAKDASLKEIIEELGSSMKIDVIGNIPEGEKISVKFDRLSLKDALEKLSSNYGYVIDSGKEENKIAKMIILPKGEESRIQEREGTTPVKHEPFKFEFDPTENMEARE